MLGRTDSRLRLVALLAALVVFAGALGLRLSYWQLSEATRLRELAAAQLVRPQVEEAQRGRITDRRGTMLAGTAYRDLLAAHPDLIRQDMRKVLALRLAGLLELGEDETAQLVGKFDEGVAYTVVARRLTEAQSQEVRAQLDTGDLAGLTLEPRPVRFYPNQGGSPSTTLASQLLGFVTEDGEGQYGIEQYHQAALAGRPGVTAALEGVDPPVAGADLQLTIDASLQLRLEKELHAAWVANRASQVSAVVMDPTSGAILAWGSVPGYDANSYAAIARSQPDRFVDPLASQVYEPGSVMKMVTAAAALEQGAVTPQTVINDSRVLKFGDIGVRNSDRRGMGPMTFADVLAHSRNVATSKVAAMLGDTTDESAAILYEMWQRLGIGARTGIELSGESGGLVSDPLDRRWQPIELANRSFGQGVAVTPLQLAVAYSAMVNGGLLVDPHVVDAVNGTPQIADRPERVLAPDVSRQLQELMVHVVSDVDQHSRDTLVPGYLVGGKTGTAQIWDAASGGWLPDVYNHTFGGFIGREEPEVVIIVRIAEAEPTVRKSWGWALEMSTNELFKRIAQDTVDVLDMAPATAPADDPLSPGP
jgi:cell division protein FtsI (penicillin-binding protein 3)